MPETVIVEQACREHGTDAEALPADLASLVPERLARCLKRAAAAVYAAAREGPAPLAV